MPIPDYKPDQKWIPKSWQPMYESYAYHGAWYSGNPVAIKEVHMAGLHTSKTKGMFWQKDPKEVRANMLHVPIAGDLAGISADLLFSEAPEIVIPEAETGTNLLARKSQERLDEIINDGGVVSRLLEAVETATALGGVFLKPTWDIEVASFPIFSIGQADASIPEFKWGILVAMTFWRTLSDDNGTYYRHLERHEKGKIYNALYKGNKNELGKRIGLSDHPDTADLQDEISTGIDALLINYVPNMRPNRQFRGSNLGQSDYAGVEGLMDALDETYTSWMRDIRLGRARIIVPETFLDFDDNGDASFDVDREIFTKLSADPITSDKASITPSQFKIRMEEHRQTSLEILERIVTHAGYSPQTFGLKIEGRAESGTALNIRERRSFVTKGKKERYWKSALENMFEMMLAIDKTHLGGSAEIFRPTVRIADSIQHDINTMAESINKLNQAQAVSVDTKIRMLHQDWSEEQITAERNAIMKEQGIGLVDDPIEIGGNSYPTT